jgi:hypothetical protein
MHAEHPKIAVQTLEHMGRGLIAHEDAVPGEVLLSVPFTSVFMDTEVTGLATGKWLPCTKSVWGHDGSSW